MALAKVPYGSAEPEGRGFDFPWGSVAVLNEPIAGGTNILESSRQVVAWVGDLVTEMTDAYVRALLDRVAGLREARTQEGMSFEQDEVFRQLNGAFAILCADSEGVCIIPDVVGSLAVFVGYDREGRVRSIGTHQDLVAVLTGEPLHVDHVSAAEFLNSAWITFPHTMHERVKRLDPARVHSFQAGDNGLRRVAVPYWHPPQELVEYDEDELAAELRASFIEAVTKRCKGDRIAVSLSGGLDSRLVLAAVPKSVECIGVTFCDELNREARTAAKVAKCYGRSWVPLFRDPEHVANMTEAAVRFIGCEGFFLDAHVIGLTEEICQYQVGRVLSGLKMDTYLRCYYADDMVRVPQLAGLLPPKYVHQSYDFAGNIGAFCVSALQQAVLAGLRERRTRFVNQYADPRRTSPAEWLRLHPVFSGLEGWPAERRVLPTVTPGLDRKLIEFCFKCPVALKVGSRVYLKAAKDLYGPGGRIPNANDGVRPGSGHWARLAQRGARKLHDWLVGSLERVGRKSRIEHSWHDYQACWEKSGKIAELRGKYGANLDRFDGALFKGKGRASLENRGIDWQMGFRLLQIAVWSGVVEAYEAAVKREVSRNEHE